MANAEEKTNSKLTSPIQKPYPWQRSVLDLLKPSKEENDDSRQLWWIIGKGGVGKTALAVHAAMTFPNISIYISSTRKDLQYVNDTIETKQALFDMILLDHEWCVSYKNFEDMMQLGKHIICMSCFTPDITKLKGWKIFKINDEMRLVEV